MFSSKIRSGHQHQEAERTQRFSHRKTLVMATPPTPNGDLHIGHLSGPYLRADIHTRYLKMRGIETYYFSGMDDHQSYVPLKAAQIGLSASQTADQFGDMMTKTLQAARIDTDLLVRPRKSPYHIKLVQKFFEKLYSEGRFVAKEVLSQYCENCEKYLFEAYIRGRCPHCDAESGGNACEECGHPNDCLDLSDARCNLCGEQPTVRPFTRLYFPLSQYEEQLRDYYKSVQMSPHLTILCDQMLDNGLPDIAVSHLSDWGIPVPVDGFEGQSIYVWFEMAPGYMAATQELNEQTGSLSSWKTWWQMEDREIVQFFGFDNGYFHAVLFPALFFAYDPAIRPPRTFLTNEFYRLDGLKFSTSRNHAIWGSELLKQVPPDIVRFYLSYSGPETEQTNFTLSDFKYVVKRELIDGWQSWLQDLGTKIAIEYAGIVPSIRIWTDEQRRFYEMLQAFIPEAASTYEVKTFSPQRTTRILCELVRTARRFGKAEDYWKHGNQRKEERRTAVALELAAAKILALLSAPIMPDFATQLWKCLGESSPLLIGGWKDIIPNWEATLTKIDGLDGQYFPNITSSLVQLNLDTGEKV